MCTFNVIYKDNAAINGITVKKNSFIPVNFYGSYAIDSRLRREYGSWWEN
jgi:hypothetical protein